MISNKNDSIAQEGDNTKANTILHVQLDHVPARSNLADEGPQLS